VALKPRSREVVTLALRQLLRLARAQWHARQEGALEWRIRRANLPERWSLETNLDYDEGPNFLGNRPMVEALLSRLRHYCHTVRINGPSLRHPQG